VPEIAARHHLELVGPVVDAALDEAGVDLPDLGMVAVTSGPGLVGALLIGLAHAKGLAFGAGLPFVAVDHLDAHVLSPTLGDDPAEPPYVCLLASGGHTQIWHVAGTPAGGRRLVADTRDDAAGEAFDKGARLLGLPYPGGPALERLAASGDAGAVHFPAALPGRLEFSFSGLKTALLYAHRDARAADCDLAAAYQAAIIAALVEKVELAIELTGAPSVAVAGGVGANGPLRQALADLAARRGLRLALPERRFCTDNAAMVANAGRFLEAIPCPNYLGIDASPTGPRSPATALA
jgi:N6-L-threonylcarbamoyladenine synthase